MPGSPDEGHFYSDCAECQWARYTKEEWQGQVISVLHVLKKHPEVYQRETGNDPEKKLFEYRELLRAFRNLI